MLEWLFPLYIKIQSVNLLIIKTKKNKKKKAHRVGLAQLVACPPLAR